MAALRFLAGLFLLTTAIALVADLTPRLAGTGHPPLTSIYRLWIGFAPGSLHAVKGLVSQISPLLWDPLVSGFLAAPLVLTAGLLALLCGYTGRKRTRIEVFTN